LFASFPARTSADDVATLIGLAYRYAFPAYELARVRYALQFDPTLLRHLPSNFLLHNRNLASAASRLITAPNADTLYSLAFVDLRGGPVRIDVPEMGGRYYSIALMDMYTNDFAYLGRRTTGTHAGSFLLVGPGQKREPDGQAVIIAPTPTVVLLSRILVTNPNDLGNVHRLQDGIVLSAPGKVPAAPRPIAPVPGSGVNFVSVVNQALAENPPPRADESVLERIAAVGVGPSAAPMIVETERAWNEHFADVQRQLVVASRRRNPIKGWTYPAADIGRFGTDYDTRARVALSGLLANVREEDMGLTAVADNMGAPLLSEHAYRLRLPRRMPVDAFWSLTMYQLNPDGRMFFFDNPLQRYAIGDRTEGLGRNPDGSLDILIQRDRPDGSLAANWLPMPAGPFRLMLRNYQPTAPLLEGQFRYAPVERMTGNEPAPA